MGDFFLITKYMMSIKRLLILIVLLVISLKVQLYSQNLNGFKLPNGLTVYIWEDQSQSDVFGIVGVRAGAFDDPSDLTGLAHYLEHVMFKGTEKIGALDWQKEKPLYEQIIAKYDEMAAEFDPVRKAAINKEINRLTVEASQYTFTNEFASLTELTGGTGLNAGTSYDYTVYHNAFPPSEIFRWLELNSERFMHPVFRAFQTELETVYEEFNRMMDSQGRQESNFLLSTLFPEHPYAQPIIGLPEHLKNPQLSRLIEFYDEWYTPENMVLVLSGNVKANQVKGLINNTFGRLEARAIPEKKVFQEIAFKGRKQVSAKISSYPQLLLGFKGIPKGHSDKLVLDICMSLLSNGSRTGLLDKLALDGDLFNAGASQISFREQGRIIVSAVPYFDMGRRTFNSLGSTEKMLLKEIEKLQRGEIDEWLLNSVKGRMLRMHDLVLESNENIAEMLVDVFIYDEDPAEILSYKEQVMNVTLDEVKAVAKKYFTQDFLAIQMQEGKPKKEGQLDKPEYDALKRPHGESAYSLQFANLPVRKDEPVFIDFANQQTKSLNQLSKLFYKKNDQNEVFTLILKYGVGTDVMPKLDYAVQLMNDAGVMAQYDPQQFKQELSRLNASCRFSVSDSYLYVTIEGFESELTNICQLVMRQMLMPDLQEKQLNSVIGNAIQMRRIEKERIDVLNNAANSYLLYQDQSDYIDRLPLADIQALTISDLTGEFSRATDYEAEIHYVGSLPFEDVYNILSANLPLKAQERPSTSPVLKDRNTYTENTIYLVTDNDAQQSGIYFFIEGKPYTTKEKALIKAFNQYFGGGFNGLVMQEIREYRSMAYSAYGGVSVPPLQGKNIQLQGYIGTQPDKTVEAITVFLDLLNNLPKHPERMEEIKQYLSHAVLTNKPSFRNENLYIEAQRLLGYTEDPAKSELSLIQEITFEELYAFYEKEIKGKPIGVAIVTNGRSLDSSQLENLGKVIKVSKNKLFSVK